MDTHLPVSFAADRRACEREEDFLVERLSRKAPHRRILEVGPGAGRVTRHLLSLCDELTLCDSSSEKLDRLRELLPGDHLRAKMRMRHLAIDELADLPGYGQFDAAVAVRVLPLVEDWEKSLWTLCDAVRPGGWVVFDLLSRRSWPGLVSRWVSPRQMPGRMLARGEIDAAVRALPLEDIETLRWGYPRWACFDADPWCGKLAPGFALGTTFLARRCSPGAE